jgi:undecaprenyl diphosphate synthase
MADTDVGLQHVAIVMDGNGRWASKRFLPRIAGHKQGVDTLKRIVRACAQRHIAVLTVFAFSSENWSRPEEEVSGLMDLLAGALAREVSQLKQDGVRLRFVGDRSGLSERVQAGLTRAELDTADNSLLTLNVCFNYGGRWEIAHAAAQLAKRGEPIDVDSLSRAISQSVFDPDLLIRTGGEFRLSNFLLWQCAYTELYFSPALWPDFDEHALDQAIGEYHARERRFGKTSAQLTPSSVSPK